MRKLRGIVAVSWRGSTRRVARVADARRCQLVAVRHAADDRGRFWFVETRPQPNRLVGSDPRRAAFFSVTPIPGGGSTVRHMVFDAALRTLWFCMDSNTIVRAEVP